MQWKKTLYLVKQLFGHISQSIVGKLAVVSLVTLGTSVEEFAWVLACYQSAVKEYVIKVSNNINDMQ